MEKKARPRATSHSLMGKAGLRHDYKRLSRYRGMGTSDTRSSVLHGDTRAMRQMNTREPDGGAEETRCAPKGGQGQAVSQM